MEEIDEGRRNALKKLGIGTGAVYVAPTVTALVVPTHATATSSSGGSASTTGGTFVSGQQYTATVPFSGTTYTIAFTPSTSGSSSVTGVSLDSISPSGSYTTVDAKLIMGPAPSGYTTVYPSPAPTPNTMPYSLAVKLS